jgi:transposase
MLASHSSGTVASHEPESPLAELKELRKVKKAYKQLQLEHDLLKKAIAFTSKLNATSSPSSPARKAPR